MVLRGLTSDFAGVFGYFGLGKRQKKAPGLKPLINA